MFRISSLAVINIEYFGKKDSLKPLEIHIFDHMGAAKTPDRPALGPKWFWDMDYDRIDWKASYKSIIARIIE